MAEEPRKPRYYVVLRQKAFADLEAILLKNIAKGLLKDEPAGDGENLWRLDCTAFEAPPGDAFARVTVIDPNSADSHFELLVPTHFILFVVDVTNDARLPFGFKA